MLKTSYKTPSSRIASAAWSSLLLCSGLLLAEAARAQLPEGRPNLAEGRQTAPLPGSASPYERKRIKRTVPLDSLQGWDVLYESEGSRVYFDWDTQFLYLAVESATPDDLRVDLDASGDGWFQGAENFSLRLVRTGESLSALVRRFDTVQNREHPVWAEVALPEGALQVRPLALEKGSAVVLALPIGFLGQQRKLGAEFGLRILTGASAATEPQPETPMVRLQLAEDSEAIVGPLSARLLIKERRLVAGAAVQGSLELANTSAKPIFLKQVLLPDGKSIVDLKDPIMILNPGERLRREFRFPLPAGPEPASVVLQAGAEREEGGVRVIALASVERQEPFSLTLDHDSKPIAAAAPDGPARRRLVVATITGRREGRNSGTVQLALPVGWSVDGEPKRNLSLSFPNERRSVSFKLIAPPNLTAGRYPVEVECEIGGKSYRDKIELVVQ